MAQANGDSRSILRLLFWEGLAVVGLAYIRLHPYADRVWDLYFFNNSIFFLVAYPLLFIHRWKLTGGCLATLTWPLGFVLSWGLGVSAYLWITYLLLINNSPYFYAMERHFIPLGILFAFLYFPLIQPILGVGRKYPSLGRLVWILFCSALGGFIGYETGWILSHKFPLIRADNGRWFLVWLGIVFLGTAAGALIAQKQGEK